MLRIASLSFAALLGVTAMPSHAVTIAQNYNGTEIAGAGTYYLGQSFTVEGSGTFNNIAISFYTGYGASIPYSDGSLFLYSSEFTGLVSQLGSGANFLGTSVTSNGAFAFAPALTLTGGVKYFAYMDNVRPSAQYTGGNPYASGQTFQADSSSGNRFYAIPTVDLRFGASGTPSGVAAVPEPASWALMLVGFGAIGGAMRSRKATVRFA